MSARGKSPPGVGGTPHLGHGACAVGHPLLWGLTPSAEADVLHPHAPTGCWPL